MIPTMILFGLVTGYWWKFALPAAAVIWPTLLLASDTITASQIPTSVACQRDGTTPLPRAWDHLEV